MIGVEPELENDAWLSFRSGRIQTLPSPSASIADAIKVQALGTLTFPVIQQFVDDIMTVSEASIARACLLAYSDAHLVVEPGGAVGLAGALDYGDQESSPRAIVAIACGGNVLLSRLAELASFNG